MSAPTLVVEDHGVAYERINGITVRPACPRCPWRGHRSVAAGTYRWRAWLAADISLHDCTNPPPDQETNP